MVALPSQTPTVDSLYQLAVDRNNASPPRGYLGCSIIGTECRRALWLGFRNVGRAPFEGRILRLFMTGHLTEDRIVADLRATGIEVVGTQYAVSECEGHLCGHIDGVVLGLAESPKTYHLLEVKTSNRKGFDAIKRDGAEKEKPIHFAQMQIYMHLAGLKRAAYLVVCKDTDEIYMERIKRVSATGKALVMKAQAIISADSPPDRAYGSPSFYKCKFCDFARVCWQPIFPDVNCRSCVHSSPVADGRWTCGRDFSMDDDCTEHIYIPGLLHWDAPITGEFDWIEYSDFVNATATSFGGADCGKPMKTSRELYETTAEGC